MYYIVIRTGTTCVHTHTHTHTHTHITIIVFLQYTALYDYTPVPTSPGTSSSEELPLTAGTVVKVLDNIRDDGLVKVEVRTYV